MALSCVLRPQPGGRVVDDAKVGMDSSPVNRDKSARRVTNSGTMMKSSLTELDAVLVVARCGKS
ncbi:hypothetical protein, partial [Klebsiella pneumoniae]|uniref:hypothetical protein n=1 Tax=Klebsiella pneumoniae TaxID=573 RepID=UPI00210BC624